MGLKNGSATCYMNAVFQQLFMTPGVRMAVLAEPEELEVTRKDSIFYQMQVCVFRGSCCRCVIGGCICNAAGHMLLADVDLQHSTLLNGLLLVVSVLCPTRILHQPTTIRPLQ